MGAATAVNILHRRKLAAASVDDRQPLRLQLIDEQTRTAGSVGQAVKAGVVDEIIEPTQTRHRIAQALAQAPAGRGFHGNIPL
jgi:acetyl-CoA/propionyl-CoA carboxylase carboxyl transferase subunit